MKRKMKRNLAFSLVTLAIVFSLVFSFEEKTNAASSPSNQVADLNIDTVDGIKYSPDKHKNIAGMVVEITDQGEKVLGFSTSQKYEAYLEQEKELSSNKNIGIMTRPANYFREHTSNEGYGSRTWLWSGSSTPYVGNLGGYGSHWWNDRISAVGVAKYSWVRLYQHSNYRGYSITLRNKSNRIYYTNLTSYRMPDGRSWNDQTSSISTGSY